MTQRKRTIHSLPALLFWIGLWWLCAERFGNPLLLPGPWQVLKCLGTLASTGPFWQMVALSIGRILLGVAAGTVLGALLGVLTSSSRVAELLISPAMTAMQATPVASFAILVLIWLDRDWVPVLICGMMVLPVVWNGVQAGIRSVDVQLLEMAKVYRISPLRRLLRIWIPSVLPFFRAACTSSLGLGWKAGIAAEVLTVPKISIGKMISEAKLYLMTEELFAWTLTVVILSLLLQKGMLHLLKGREGNA